VTKKADQMIWRHVPSKPPQDVVAHAINAAVTSPCQSKRGVAVFRYGETGRPVMVTTGFNHQVKPLVCDGSDACKSTCRHKAVHAEQDALLLVGPRAEGCDLLHVKVMDGQAVPSGGPSCVQCSKLIVRAGVAGVWLLHAMGWRRYDAEVFHALSLSHMDNNKP
jgi:deoxycytidylate deaminase